MTKILCTIELPESQTPELKIPKEQNEKLYKDLEKIAEGVKRKITGVITLIVSPVNPPAGETYTNGELHEHLDGALNRLPYIEIIRKNGIFTIVNIPLEEPPVENLLKYQPASKIETVVKEQPKTAPIKAGPRKLTAEERARMTGKEPAANSKDAAAGMLKDLFNKRH